MSEHDYQMRPRRSRLVGRASQQSELQDSPEEPDTSGRRLTVSRGPDTPVMGVFRGQPDMFEFWPGNPDRPSINCEMSESALENEE